LIKLKKAETREKRSFLVDCFDPSDILLRKGRILSEVMDVNSMFPK
jgi:hypothetical protein